MLSVVDGGIDVVDNTTSLLIGIPLIAVDDGAGQHNHLDYQNQSTTNPGQNPT